MDPGKRENAEPSARRNRGLGSLWVGRVHHALHEGMTKTTKELGGSLAGPFAGPEKNRNTA